MAEDELPNTRTDDAVRLEVRLADPGSVCEVKSRVEGTLTVHARHEHLLRDVTVELIKTISSARQNVAEVISKADLAHPVLSAVVVDHDTPLAVSFGLDIPDVTPTSSGPLFRVDWAIVGSAMKATDERVTATIPVDIERPAGERRSVRVDEAGLSRTTQAHGHPAVAILVFVVVTCLWGLLSWLYFSELEFSGGVVQLFAITWAGWALLAFFCFLAWMRAAGRRILGLAEVIVDGSGDPGGRIELTVRSAPATYRLPARGRAVLEVLECVGDSKQPQTHRVHSESRQLSFQIEGGRHALRCEFVLPSTPIGLPFVFQRGWRGWFIEVEVPLVLGMPLKLTIPLEVGPQAPDALPTPAAGVPADPEPRV